MPSYDWFLMYNNAKGAFQAYLSGGLSSQLAVTPQQMAWQQYDGYSLSLVKFFFSYKLQLMAMWKLPVHFFNKPYRSDFDSPGYNIYLTNDKAERDLNKLTFTVVWRFRGGEPTRKYKRSGGSVSIY